MAARQDFLAGSHQSGQHRFPAGGERELHLPAVMWGIRDIYNTPASTAATADLIVFSMSGERPLAASVCKWIEMWNWPTDHHPPTVVVLSTNLHSKGAGILVYLQRAVAEKKLRLFVPPSQRITEMELGHVNQCVSFLRAAKSSCAVEA